MSQATRSSSPRPPPPMHSPQLVHTPLPTPPPLPRRRSSRLQLPTHQPEPPIPPRLIGSPLLQRVTREQPRYISEKAQAQLWLDGDEFGSSRKETAHLQPIAPPSPLLRSPRSPKDGPNRSPPNRRSNSPPPAPRVQSPPPPVPPLPPSALATPGSKRATMRPVAVREPSHVTTIPELVLSSPLPSAENHRCAPAVNGVTCYEFITLHNSSRRVIT